MKHPATQSAAANLSPARRRLALLMGQAGALAGLAGEKTTYPDHPTQNQQGGAVEHQPQNQHGSRRADGKQQVSRKTIHAGTFEEKAAPSGRKTGSDRAAVGAGGTAPGEKE